ncbi:MAG: hypothetical protein AAF446_03810 [Pseudomonadota bacterium]
MFKGVFPRWVAVLGLLALPAALIGGLLKSTLVLSIYGGGRLL